jgi:hypothetical protein
MLDTRTRYSRSGSAVANVFQSIFGILFPWVRSGPVPFTRIPFRPCSTARHVLKCATAAFIAPYTGSPG